MKNSFWCIIGLVGLLALGSLAEATDWVQYSMSSRRTLFYDASSISHPSKDLVRVWKKTEWSQEGVDQQIALRGKHGLSTAGYEKYSYTTSMDEINCSTQESRCITFTEYGNDGAMLDSQKGSQDWEAIIPDSAGAELYRQVCKKKGKR